MTQRTAPRVRFAPSPTGYLHVGGARTALFNWLFARRHGGVFVLRIEDTDRERSSDAMTQAILDGMRWLGLEWDEGPYHQADGLSRHQRDAQRLVEAGRAYRCFCTVEQLDARRNAHPDGPNAFRYDRRCVAIPAAQASARAAAGEPHTVRFLSPPGRTAWNDAVYGEISFENTDIEDFIIMRTDGTPIYNMAVVSDDVDMRITHVIRGDDHISNTPKQILLYQALGAEVPVFAHVPMILGPDGKRLSKRHGATAIGEYETQGILPDAMINFLALLGWSPGDDEEILDREELTRRFDLDGINRKSAVFDPKKLEWMNGRYMAARSSEDLGVALRTLLADHADAAALPDAWWIQLAELLKVRARTTQEMAQQSLPYIGELPEYDEDAVARHWKDSTTTAERLEELRRRFAALDPFDAATLEETLRSYAEELGVGAGKVSGASPGIFDVALLLGRDRVLRRIDAAIYRLQHGSTPS
jgi:glutamyl-tRNA synthetase